MWRLKHQKSYWCASSIKERQFQQSNVGGFAGSGENGGGADSRVLGSRGEGGLYRPPGGHHQLYGQELIVMTAAAAVYLTNYTEYIFYYFCIQQGVKHLLLTR